MPVWVLFKDRTIDAGGAKEIRFHSLWVRKGRKLTIKNLASGRAWIIVKHNLTIEKGSIVDLKQFN